MSGVDRIGILCRWTLGCVFCLQKVIDKYIMCIKVGNIDGIIWLLTTGAGTLLTPDLFLWCLNCTYDVVGHDFLKKDYGS